jgi:hypothetical protein
MTGFVPRSSSIVKPASDGMARRVFFSTWLLGAGASALLPHRAQSAAPDRVSTFVDFSSRIASRLDVRDDQVSFGLDSMELHEVYAIRVEEV